MDTFDQVLGREKLTSIFGGWPSFHDAEVLWFRLDRRSTGAGYGPTVDVMVHLFEMTNEVGVDGYLVLRNHVLAHFEFREAVEIHLSDFGYQNALWDLSIIDIRDRQMERIDFQVAFVPSFGIEASFQCHEIEVLSVMPCDKSGVLARA